MTKNRAARHHHEGEEDVSPANSSSSSTGTIEISVQEWARHNKVMIELLRALEEGGKKRGGAATRGLSTVQLLQKVSRTHNAQEMIKRAEEEGLIRRESKAPGHKGNWLVVNYLTPKGKQLLDKLAR
jgi:hypothetical protein